MEAITVRPGDDEDLNSQVAFWEASPEHAEVNDQWEMKGGAFIVGDPENPETEYVIARTEAAVIAIQKGRLVLVEGDPVEVPQKRSKK